MAKSDSNISKENKLIIIQSILDKSEISFDEARVKYLGELKDYVNKLENFNAYVDEVNKNADKKQKTPIQVFRSINKPKFEMYNLDRVLEDLQQHGLTITKKQLKKYITVLK